MAFPYRVKPVGLPAAFAQVALSWRFADCRDREASFIGSSSW